MSENQNCERRVRPLYDWEIAEARKVFGDRLRYDQVRVHECSTWTDAIDHLGRRLKRLPPPGPLEHNAVTLGNHSHFPVNLPQQLAPPDDPLSYFMPWLIHELTHVWQYQQTGWIYMLRALSAQFRYGAEAYNFGGEANLIERRQAGWTITRFNPEQQGEIARTYYDRQRHDNTQDEPKKENPLSAFRPYINDIQELA